MTDPPDRDDQAIGSPHGFGVTSSGCDCDFCTGKKDWNDNWCPQCAKVKMSPPKWYENLDVCDDCDEENAAYAADRDRG